MNHIRRELNRRNSKGHFTGPFAGKLIDTTRPLRKRFESRKTCGPYEMQPGKPGAGIGFYMEMRALACASHGARIDLRIEDANDHYKPSRAPRAYGFNEFGDTIQPIVARLPKNRGFLAGWTMGPGMCAELDATIHDTAEDAARAAHDEAEHAAERQAEFEAEEAERLATEEFEHS
jgi:hypothetical protein